MRSPIQAGLRIGPDPSHLPTSTLPEVPTPPPGRPQAVGQSFRARRKGGGQASRLAIAQATGAEGLPTKLFWAIGYNVAETHVATICRNDLVLGDGATITLNGKRR